MTTEDLDVRSRLAIALDVDDLARALELAHEVEEHIGVAKVGLELFTAVGPRAFEVLHGEGFSVFADLKLHDIPTTVEHAARAVGLAGVEYLNFHAAGGAAMLAPAARAYREAARSVGISDPVALAVTVLTSDADTGAFDERLQRAQTSGCDGVVCSGFEIDRVRARWPDAVTMVPGIRMAGDDHNDQARVMNPRHAARAGATVAVIGRSVTAAADPRDAARRVAASFAAGLSD